VEYIRWQHKTFEGEGGGLYTEDLTYGGRMYPPEVSGWWHPSVGRTRRPAEYGVRRAGRRCISGPRT